MEEIKFCSHCGQPIKPDDEFCQNCGARLKEEKPSANPNVFDNPLFDAGTRNTSETPLLEKTKMNILNYSQILRRNLYLNPAPLFIGLAFLALSVAEVLLEYFRLEDKSYFYISFLSVFVCLFYLVVYLIISPLNMIHKTKTSKMTNYKMSFYSHHLHYLVEMNYLGQPVKNELNIRYNELYKYKEFKDMGIFIFVTHGMKVPLCFLKDENYNDIVKFFRPRMDELDNAK